ncbi:Dual specificity protein phosphatase 16 [Boothiomyces sp. JEL0866]|nr:Dual specificity protein phosphatase 16 [Boothiomyces sp. JEL0866]KAJ3321562.1 Dual specificity protein phosphatase 16 [Boothiomyces sp. JEL0866]
MLVQKKTKMMRSPLSIIVPETQIIQNQHQDYNAVSPYVNGPAEIVPGLYLGCGKVATDKTVLEKHNIQAVVNVAKELCLTPTSPNVSFFSVGFKPPVSSSCCVEPHTPSTTESIASTKVNSPTLKNSICRYKFEWTHCQDILPVIEEAIGIIQKCRNEKKTVLVHCQQGVSRSAALVIGYIMKTQKVSCQIAYDFVRKQAPKISPNVSLIAQLVAMEKLWDITN